VAKATLLKFIFYSFFMEISQKIIDYAIWYYMKYYPSPKKLAFKLKQKFWPESEKGKRYWWINDEEIEFIIKEKLRNIIEEKEVIKAKINNYKNKWKSRQYILWKMYERQEDSELVKEFLSELFTQDDENHNLKRELDKYKYSEELNYEEKQKIFSKIMRKWYNWDNLKKLI